MSKIGDPTSFASIGAAAHSQANAQWWLLFAILVANKPANITERKLHQILESINIVGTDLPFEKIHLAITAGTLRKTLELFKTGQYTRIDAAFKAVCSDAFPSDPRKITLDVLERVPGIGPKTARWFFLLVNPKAKVAALDTHVLKFLRDQKLPDVPKHTPPKGKNYSRLEEAFVGTAERLGLLPRDLDFFIWTVYRNNGKVVFA